MAGVRGIPFAVAASMPVRDNTYSSAPTFLMTQSIPTADVCVNASAGHLSVHVEGAHPVDVPFLFEQQPRRLGMSVALSGALDVAFAALLIFLSRLPMHAVST